jgi:hypothetical protein
LDGKITDRIKTFEDAAQCIDPIEFVITCRRNGDAPDEIAYKKLKIICRALNEGWTPDWSDSSQPKYFPWFKYNSGFGFSITLCDYWYSATTVGSRLCFHSAELAEYAGKQFQKEYNEFLSL